MTFRENPWIDRRVAQVRPAQAQAYLRRHGWKQLPSPRPQVQFFQEPQPSDDEPTMQVVPLMEQARDYVSGVVELITSLALLEDRPAVDVLNDILQQAPITTPAALAPSDGKIPPVVAGAAANGAS